MNARMLWVVAGCALLVSACAPRRIPGTQIDETGDTLEIIDVMKQFRKAFEGRDAQSVMTLVSKEFEDDGGTPEAEDDLTYETLKPTMEALFGKIEKVNLDMDVREIDVKDDLAIATYYYTVRYEIPGADDPQQGASVIKQMRFTREDGKWKIAGGI